MIRSMTGYGEADGPTAVGRLRVELRTVNHRYLNINARLPTGLARCEPELREWLRVHFARGHVNCTVRLETDEALGTAATLQVDDERVTAYLAAFRDLRDRFNLPGSPDLALLSRYNDIFVRESAEDAAEVTVEPAEFRTVVDAAARQTIRMRDDEGRRLVGDLEGRLATIELALTGIGDRAPARLVTERDRLRNAVRELTEGYSVDEMRLAQEVAYLAERWDINEEIVRFRSHIELFQELLGADAHEGVGKRLGFLVQEMHREANTLGSKANDAVISHRVIAIKEEIERLREQVENVE
ncbi:YicC family protein [soil metagenome]